MGEIPENSASQQETPKPIVIDTSPNNTPDNPMGTIKGDFLPSSPPSRMNRRNFMRLAGATGVIGATAAFVGLSPLNPDDETNPLQSNTSTDTKPGVRIVAIPLDLNEKLAKAVKNEVTMINLGGTIDVSKDTKFRTDNEIIKRYTDENGHMKEEKLENEIAWELIKSINGIDIPQEATGFSIKNARLTKGQPIDNNLQGDDWPVINAVLISGQSVDLHFGLGENAKPNVVQSIPGENWSIKTKGMPPVAPSEIGKVTFKPATPLANSGK